MLLLPGSQQEAVRVLRDALNYLHRHYGGTQAALIVASALRKVMPIERPELRRS